MSILSKSYEIPKAIISTGLSKSGESLATTAKTAGWQIVDTISATAKPSRNYISTIVSKAPGTFKADVLDTTLNDLKLSGLTKAPLKTIGKAALSPIMVVPRAGWSMLKSGWSMTTTAAKQSPKLVRDTTTTALWWVWQLAGTGVKWLTWLAWAWLAAIDAGVDTAVWWWSKSEAKK